MTLVAYAAVSLAARSFPAQLVCEPPALPSLRALTDAVHRAGCLAGIQLTHAGFFADPGLAASPAEHEQMSARRRFNPATFRFGRAMAARDEARVVSAFSAAAAAAVSAGFDCVEVHCGHGYLLSQCLSPRTNPGRCLGERLRLPLAVLRGVREATRGRALLMVKMNVSDGAEDGVPVWEACEAAAAFACEAGVDVLALSGGMILENGLYMLRGEVPLREMAAAQPSWLKKLSLALFGPFVVPQLPFDQLFFRDLALCVLHTVRALGARGENTRVCLVGGVQSLEALEVAMADGFDLVQCGRALLREPSLPLQWQARAADESACTRCNRCIVHPTMRQELIHCVDNIW